jgi:opacity protein-like surface antigen
MKVMRQLNRLAAGSAFVAAAAVANVGIAQADGAPARGRVVYEQPSNWSGFYFGVHSGFAWSEFDTVFPAFGTTFGVSHDAAIYGGQIGIQHQFGNIVLGIEGGYSGAWRDDFATTLCPNPIYNCAARFDDVLTIGPRLGWAMGKWMPYITGGYANAAFQEKGVRIANNNETFEDRQRHSGWYIGAGVDMALAHGWTIGLEYRHYELGSAAYQPHCAGILAPNCPGAGAIPFPTDLNFADVTLDTVSVRVSWKFGRPDCCAPLK